MTATRRDLVTGIVIAVIGAVYFVATFSIRETTDIVTPRTFPAIVGVALIVLGLFLAGQSVWKARTQPGGAGGRTDAEGGEASAVIIEAPPEPPGRRVVLQFALFFAYLAIVIPVGFLLSTAAFLMALTSIYSPQKWIRNLIYSVLFSVILYFAFVYGLAVYLPVGILG
ncbi:MULTISPECIES: tripartite tricarboxylate transporter TctB family protein [Brevibacterium]|uniref:Tripartite tricarboxylate transporter TctB family n=3 Tax=Brevibacterium TaxID=1696 RepID=A0A449CZY2_9MICO|nr:tripartite tricarboxylate transporter TctB family protein [Brevibacterium casei]VEW10816.1 Tripartite tricarboxylate transporter TctB family [Brevibacterium casei]